jgi:hypothetical protein
VKAQQLETWLAEYPEPWDWDVEEAS